MTIAPYKVRALLKKDIKSDARNGNTVLFMLLPLFFTVLYRSMNFGGESMPASMVLILGLLMNTCMMPTSAMAMYIAEEKEKNTLRTLMLSNVSAGEFLLSKLILTFTLTELINIAIFFIVGAEYAFLTYLLVSSLACFCLLMLGALVGLISKDQKSTGIISAPLMMLMLLPSIFAQVSEGFLSVAQFIPTYAMVALLTSNERTGFFIAVLAVWIVISTALFTIVYRFKRLDE